MVWALTLALLNAGNSIAARIAIMAITTSNSINVKAAGRCVSGVEFGERWGFLIIARTGFKGDCEAFPLARQARQRGCFVEGICLSGGRQAALLVAGLERWPSG